MAGNLFDRFRSGVARFNRILAEQLGVPVVGVADPSLARTQCPLLSVKFGELREGEPEALGERLQGRDRDASFRMFLHDVTGLSIETDLLGRAAVVYAGNEEVAQAIAPLTRRVETLWSPATILDFRRFEPAEISVFSFGMAHKMRADIFGRLHALLEATGRTYSLYVSNANHESVTLEDAQPVYDEMHDIFPNGLYFLGNLSDLAVSNFITGATYFAAFFPRGARANNSTIVAAMERGAVVVTNLDGHSPPYLRHMETVLDINRCDELPVDAGTLERMGAAAKEAADELSWERFADRFR